MGFLAAIARVNATHPWSHNDEQTFDEVRAIASDVLPGIRMRRRLFWRYTASWQAPS